MALLQSTDPQNGRRTPRRLYKRPVGIMVDGRYEVVKARQLSEGGLMIGLTYAPNGKPETQQFKLESFPVGKKMSISLILPTGPALVMVGSVIYHETKEGPYVGIKFDSVALHQRRDIRNFVSAKLASESELDA